MAEKKASNKERLREITASIEQGIKELFESEKYRNYLATMSRFPSYAKEIITIDVYGDNAEIIEDCLDDLQPFIDEVVPKEESEGGTDFSEDSYIDNLSEFLV